MIETIAEQVERYRPKTTPDDILPSMNRVAMEEASIREERLERTLPEAT